MGLYLCTWFGEDCDYMHVVADDKDSAAHQLNVYFDMYCITPMDTKIVLLSDKVLVDLCP